MKSIEKMYCYESWKSLSPQLLFEVSLFRFHFVSALQYLDCYLDCSEYPVKQTLFFFFYSQKELGFAKSYLQFF